MNSDQAKIALEMVNRAHRTAEETSAVMDVRQALLKIIVDAQTPKAAPDDTVDGTRDGV